jgi:hypothetical protein
MRALSAPCELQFLHSHGNTACGTLVDCYYEEDYLLKTRTLRDTHSSLDNHVSSSVNTTRALTRKNHGNSPRLIAVEGTPPPHILYHALIYKYSSTFTICIPLEDISDFVLIYSISAF